MQAYKRHGNRWTVNELLSLQREYELLEWTVQQIAEKHQRTVNSILFKLEEEGYINSWDSARGFDSSYFQENYTMNTQKNDIQDCHTELESECDEEVFDDAADEDYVDEGDEDDDDDYDDYNDESSEVTKLAERVWSLEATVSDISFMVKQMFDSMVNTAPKKRQLSSSAR
jgi:hypothetical protein